MEIMAPPGMEDLTSQIQGMFQQLGGGRRKMKKLSVSEALRHLTDEEAAQAHQRRRYQGKGARCGRAERHRVIDEIDKITPAKGCRVPTSRGRACSAIFCRSIEGTTVSTKYGMVKTDHVLFIASGAFHLSKPSDLIPELQGRLPIRVELEPLTAGGFRAHPDRDRRMPDAPIRGAARYRAGSSSNSGPMGFAPPGRARARRQREAGEHRRAAVFTR